MSRLMAMREQILGMLPPERAEKLRRLERDPHFVALALCGEAGELANKVKKEWRDEVSLREEIVEEICDVRIYLELLADTYGVAGELLYGKCEQKLLEVVERELAKIEDREKYREEYSQYRRDLNYCRECRGPCRRRPRHGSGMNL